MIPLIASLKGSVDPIRDLATIRHELLVKDLALIQVRHDKIKKEAKQNAKDKAKQLEFETMAKVTIPTLAEV